MLDEEIKQIVLQNQAALQKINRQLKWQTISGILKAIFIVGPIVLGIIWLLPFFQEYFPEVKSAFETVRVGLVNIQTNGLTNSNITPEQQELFCKQICR